MKRTGRIVFLCFLSLVLFLTSTISVHAASLGLCRPEQALTHTFAQIRTVPGQGAVVSARVSTARGYTGQTEIRVLREGCEAPVLRALGGETASLTVLPQNLRGCRIFILFTAVHGEQRHCVWRGVTAPAVPC